MAITDVLDLFWQEGPRAEHGLDFPGDGHGKEIHVCRLWLSALACRARRWRRSYDGLRLALNCSASGLLPLCCDCAPKVRFPLLN